MKRLIIFFIIINLLNLNFLYSFEDKFALLNAVKSNSYSKTKKFIDLKYNINLKDEAGNTALTYAINNNNYEILKLLINNNAKTNLKNNNGNYIYCDAKRSEDVRIQNLFKNHNDKKCKNTIAGKNKFWTSKNITGTIIGVGAVGGLALGLGGGGGGDDETAKQENRMSPADRNYNIVGEVDQAKLRDVLNNPRYNVLLTIGPTAYSNLDSYSDIRVAYSLARGYTGKVNSINDSPSYINQSTTVSTLPVNTKIKVAVLDSGVQTNHQDLVGNITNNLTNTNLAFNFCRDNPTSTACSPVNLYTENNPDPHFAGDGNWHGTFVAGIIGATYSNTMGVMGIAPESEIIPYRIVFNNGVFVNYKYIGDAFRYASSAGATVINNSYGIPTLDKKGNHNIDVSDIKTKNDLINIFKDGSATPATSNYINQMLNAVKNNDTIFIWAAGNEGTSQSGVNSAIPLFFDEFKNGEYYKNFINVVAYDSEIGNIASYSNRCGLTKEFCLTAPGTNIVSTSSGPTAMDDDYYGIASGTSFAAPMVSGAVAVLKGAFPYLTGAEITKLLFITARDLGELGVDDIYGWGMLDLERATRPVGVALIPIDSSINSNTVSLISSNIKLNSNIANTIKSKNLQFVILDSFNRTFTMQLNDYIETDRNRINTIKILNKFASNNSSKIALNNNKSFNLYYKNSSNDILINSNELEISYTINSLEDNRYGFDFYYGNNPYNALINDKENFYENFSLSNIYDYNVINPYFKTNSDINFAFNNNFKINDKFQTNFVVLYSNYTINYDKYYENRKKNEDLGSSFSVLTGLTYSPFYNFSSKMEIGIINEYETLFGTKWNGAFNIGSNNLTYMLNIENNIKLFKNKIFAFGRFNIGYTNVNPSQFSLIKDISSLITHSWTAGFSYNFDTKSSDSNSNISLLLVAPIKIDYGYISMSLPIARDTKGNLYYSNNKINLKDYNDINLQLVYNFKIQNDSKFNFGVIYRNYIENEAIVLLKFNKFFNF